MDSWEDQADLEEDFDALEAMFPNNYKKLGGMQFRLSCDTEGMETTLLCTLPDSYPDGKPEFAVTVKHQDHLKGGRLAHACEQRLLAWFAARSEERFLVGLGNAFVDAAAEFAEEDELSTEMGSPLTQASQDASGVMTDFEVDDGEEPIPPGSLVQEDEMSQYESRRSGMQGFSVVSCGLFGTLGYRTSDGCCVTWQPPPSQLDGVWKSRRGTWTLFGDGPLSFVELEVGDIRNGYDKDFLFGVTGSRLEDKKNVSLAHELEDVVLISFSSLFPFTSLGYMDRELYVFSDAAPANGIALQHGDRVGVWHKDQELRILQNGRPLMRIRTGLGAHATLVVQLNGRVTQLRVHIPETAPLASFDHLMPCGPERYSATTPWSKAEYECFSRLKPLFD